MKTVIIDGYIYAIETVSKKVGSDKYEKIGAKVVISHFDGKGKNAKPEYIYVFGNYSKIFQVSEINDKNKDLEASEDPKKWIFHKGDQVIVTCEEVENLKLNPETGKQDLSEKRYVDARFKKTRPAPGQQAASFSAPSEEDEEEDDGFNYDTY